jgi:hypothetical protein
MQGSQQPQLEYAPREPTRRRLARRILLGVLFSGIAIDAVLWLPIAFRKIQLLSLQRQCLNYSASPESIVFDSRSASLPQLSRSDPDLKTWPMLNGGMAIIRIPTTWTHYYAENTCSALLNCLGTPYLHRMQSPSGHERLIAASIFPAPNNAQGLLLVSDVLEPASVSSPAHDLSTRWGSNSLLLTTDAINVVIYAGQPDSEHSDHFTIQAILNGTPCMIDGWLHDDDTVTFERRNLTPPSPPSPASSH